MDIFCGADDYILHTEKMKPWDLIRFRLERLNYEDVVAALRMQHPSGAEIAVYRHGDVVHIQGLGDGTTRHGKKETCVLGRSGVKV